ncbi:MAG TPA: family 20 glycosylhydrolase [Gemmatimonadales bacterium]|nr:family 20 glycosylhydrolase [Gemmatimonadales bacterium]
MPRPLLMLLAGLAPALAAQQAPATPSLMPMPRSIELGQARLRIDSGFSVAVLGYSDARLTRAVRRTIDRLARRTGITLADSSTQDSATARLVIRAQGAGQAIQTETEDESYTLEVTSGRAQLQAPTVVGVLRGVETLLQLVATDSAGFFIPEVRITDAPRFSWRGLLVDAGRHFEPVEVIKRTLDGMAVVKLNVLHWHLSEDQGFRVESKRFPLLQRDGSDGLFYTQAQIRDVVAYARDRGIRVVPEFDMPGHFSSWLVGYPRYGSGRGPYRIQRTWGVFDPTLDPTRDLSYTFVDAFIGEMVALFPDPYWHVGGDEVNGVEWDANRRIRAFKRDHHLADNAALQAYFNQRLSVILTKHGKQMVGWDEILNPDLPATAVVQSWRGLEYLPQTVRAGHRAILSAPYYLDHMESAEDHYVDPLPDSLGLSPEEAARLMGGEACMWGEHIGPETIDSRIWPRLAAVAEKLWSPASVKDVHDMYRRLAATSLRLTEVGLGQNEHTARMLHLAVGNGPDFQTMMSLLALSQPVTFGQRHRLQVGMTQQTPLTRLIDAARPDPPSRWGSLTMVERFVADSGTSPVLRDSLRQAFTAWQTLAPAVHAIAVRTPLARDGVQAVDALARVAGVGSAALDRYAGTVAGTAAWRDSARVVLDSATGPQGLLRLTVVDAVRWLVEDAPVKTN